MKLVFKLGLALLFTGICFAGLAADNNPREYTKAIKREFDISANGTTSISNKYGKVDVKTWNRQRVKIEVTILVDASSESKAQEVFDRIDVAFSNSATSVKAVTTIEPRKKGFWSWVKGDDSNDYSINYEVFLPATNNLELTHKYGDAFVADLSGKVTADIKYANIKLEGVGDDSGIRLGYGNGSIIRAEDLTVEVSYAKMNIQEAKDIQLNSKYTKIAIDQATDIRSNSKYDDYVLGSIRDFYNAGKYDNIDIQRADNVEVSSRYSQVNAREVTQTLDLDLQYGGARTGLGQDFREASLVGNYSDFKLNVDRQASYQMDASATYAGIVYPRALTVTYELEKGSTHEVKGHLGNAKASALIKARLSYGGLKVIEQ